MVARVHNLDRSGLRVDIIGYQQVKDLEHAYMKTTKTTRERKLPGKKHERKPPFFSWDSGPLKIELWSLK